MTTMPLPEDPWSGINEQQRQMMAKALRPIFEQQRQMMAKALQPMLEQQRPMIAMNARPFLEQYSRLIAKDIRPILEQQRQMMAKAYSNPQAGPAPTFVDEMGTGGTDTPSMAAHIAEEIRSALGESPAQWYVALCVFMVVMWTRFQIGQVSPGSYSPDVLLHVWEGGLVGTPAAIGTKRALNTFFKGD